MYKYQEVTAELKKMFTSGHYAPGDLLPSQEWLAAHFHTTRLTVRKAIQSLIMDGVVYSKRGAGTFLRKDFRSSQADFTPLNRPVGTTETMKGRKVTSKILSFAARLASEDEQHQLMIGPAEPVYVIERVRYVDGRTYSFEHTIMPVAIMPLTEEILKGSIYAALRAHGITIAGSHRKVYALKATAKDVEALGATLNDPVLAIKQVNYTEEGKPFDYSEVHFPYETTRVSAEIKIAPFPTKKAARHSRAVKQ
ncbi:GntR family transcriptional regulator [Lacticaseibacillus hegangensis]|uniref:GntR family transcriptional regulator n=1 Tax=Lacticaseibacillus hegangensis TaxID=2486010 RepID=A0ABW4CZU8_9LACO|nr:GntR family transcriptional regulator [Lacticaseibacillus hegangensis]